MNGFDSETEYENSEAIYNYHKEIGNLLKDLKQIREMAGKLNLSDVVDTSEQVINRTENSIFNVAVVGEFKRVKSTLINALLGQPVLPADVLPCSATLNRVTFGLSPSVDIVFKAAEGKPACIETIEYEKLPEYVTKLSPESKKRASDIKEAIVYFPTPYCRDKADIIDTPGLNDDVNMTDITLSVLPQSDVAILLVLAQSPFSGYEGQFLNERLLMNDIGKVLFVVNRLDEIEEENRSRLIDYIEHRILESVKMRAAQIYGENSDDYRKYLQRIGKPKVIGLSAKEALKAKQEGNDNKLVESGFLEFEKALDHLLIHDRGFISMQVLVSCCVVSVGKVLQCIELQESSLILESKEFEDLYRSTCLKLEELRSKFEQEQAKIDQSSIRALTNARKCCEYMERDINLIVSKLIDEFEIYSDELTAKEGQEKIISKLNANVEKEISSFISKLTEQIQIEIEKELYTEIDRLGTFVNQVNETLNKIRIEFIILRNRGQQSIVAEGALAALPIIGGIFLSPLAFGLGGLSAGAREGFKGILVGGSSGLIAAGSTLLATAYVLASLAVPLTLPVVILAGILMGTSSWLGGRFAVNLVFRHNIVQEFKDNYRKSLITTIKKQILELKDIFDNNIKQYISSIFDALQNQLHQELVGPIEQTQKTLDEMRKQRTRSETERGLLLKDLGEQRLVIEEIKTRVFNQYEKMCIDRVAEEENHTENTAEL